MKITDNFKPITGTLHLRAYDRAGAEMWRSDEKNLIVASGYTAAAEALAGIPGAKIVNVAVGTNGTEPTPEDTAIKNAVVIPIQSVTYPAPATVRFNFVIGYDTANGVNIREFGLLTEDGRLFSRRVREVLEKSQYLTVSGSWEIRM